MKIGQRKGFSLIEIGIVMVVIGLIIAAVMKGKDVISNAEMKNNNQAFFNKWVNVADGYYDKTGLYLKSGTTTSPDTLTDAIDAIDRTGLKRPGKTVVLRGKDTNENTVTVGFLRNEVFDGNIARNMVYFTNIPGDIAIAYDKLVDGEANGQKGKARIIAERTTTNGSATADEALGTTTTTNGIALSAAGSGIPITDMVSTNTYDIVVILEHTYAESATAQQAP